MLVSSLLATLTLGALASARITGFYVPDVINQGTTFEVKIRGENYIQSVQDVAVSFGLSKQNTPGSLGTYLDSAYIGKANSNIVGNITRSLTIPSGYPYGRATIKGSLFALYGALASPTIEYFVTNVTIAEPLPSAKYIFSERAQS